MESVQSLLIRPSRKLREFLYCNLPESENFPDTIRQLQQVAPDLKTNLLLSISDAKWVHNYIKSSVTGDDVPRFFELMEGVDLVLPELPVEPRNPELEARIQKLKMEQTHRDYRSMTKNVDAVRYREPEESIAAQIKNINRQLIAVGQFVISVGAGFLFGFLGVELMIGDLDFGFRLLLGVIVALIIALAEIYFLAKKLNEDLYAPPEAPLNYGDPDDEVKLHKE